MMIARVVRLASVAAVLVPLRSDLPPQKLPVYGGGGGSEFPRSCDAAAVLTGLRYRIGATFDAIDIMCRPVLGSGALGPQTTVGTQAGGTGGTSKTISCAANQVITGAEIDFATYVGRIYIECREWKPATRTFGGEVTRLDTGFDLQPFKQVSHEACESSHQPARAIRGRAASFVDALGFICDEP